MPQIEALVPAALTVNEAVAYSRISRASLYRVMSLPGSLLRTSKIGSRRLILRASLDDLLSQGAAIPAPPKSETPLQASAHTADRKARGKARRKARAA